MFGRVIVATTMMAVGVSRRQSPRSVPQAPRPSRLGRTPGRADLRRRRDDEMPRCADPAPLFRHPRAAVAQVVMQAAGDLVNARGEVTHRSVSAYVQCLRPNRNREASTRVGLFGAHQRDGKPTIQWNPSGPNRARNWSIRRRTVADDSVGPDT